MLVPLVAGAALVGVGAAGGAALREKREPAVVTVTQTTARLASACPLNRQGVRVVNLDNTLLDGDAKKHLPILRHAWAVDAERGPQTWHIDRDGADANRDASLRGIPSWGQLTRARRQQIDPQDWRMPHDRDEVPPAVAREGGRGADVAYVVAWVNRSAGAVMGNQLSGCPDGTPFRYERKPGPK